MEISAVIADSDPDNTIGEAVDTEVSSQARQSASFSNAIDSQGDVDLYRFQLDRGDTIALDIDAANLGSKLDSVLQIFDKDGNQLASNDDGSASDEDSNLDSYLEFTAETTADYYIGASSYGNFDYDLINGSNNFSNNFGSTTGSYNLAIDITESI